MILERQGFWDSFEKLNPDKKLKEVIKKEYDFLREFIKDNPEKFENKDYPAINSMDDLVRFFEFVGLIKKMSILTSNDLLDYMKEKKMSLGLSLSNRCNRGCLHCASDSTPDGEIVPYEKLTGFSNNFLKLIDEATFGLEGEPLDYEYNGKNLADIIEHYANKGIKKYALSTGGTVSDISKKALNAIKNKPISLKTRLTYSLYPGINGNSESNDNIFLKSLENLADTIPEVNVQILGDKYFQETNIQKALERFDSIISKNGYLSRKKISDEKDPFKSYAYNKGNKKIIVGLTSAIDNVGRFTKVIENKLLTLINPKIPFKEPEISKKIICEHLFDYKKIVVDYKGNARFCDTTLSYGKPTIANIYEEGEQAFFDKWYNYNDLCRQYVLSNINKIMHSKAETCLCKAKLRN